MSAQPRYSQSVWARYWAALGGGQAIWRDKYMWTAALLAVASLPLWLQPLWWDSTINVLAILIGFSISGFSVALTIFDKLGNRLYRRRAPSVDSPFVKFIAGYINYLVIGFGALGLSFLSKAWYLPTLVDQSAPEGEYLVSCLSIMARGLWVVSGFMFCYSMTSAVRCVMSIFRYSDVVQRGKDRENSTQPDAKIQSASVIPTSVGGSSIDGGDFTA